MSNLELNVLVEIYKNLHKSTVDNPVYSIRSLSSRLVIGYASELYLKDIVFKVSAAGNERCRREKVKNVHAVIRGKLVGFKNLDNLETPVRYNPYKFKTFVFSEDETPILNSNKCFVGKKGVFV